MKRSQEELSALSCKSAANEPKINNKGAQDQQQRNGAHWAANRQQRSLRSTTESPRQHQRSPRSTIGDAEEIDVDEKQLKESNSSNRRRINNCVWGMTKGKPAGETDQELGRTPRLKWSGFDRLNKRWLKSPGRVRILMKKFNYQTQTNYLRQARARWRLVPSRLSAPDWRWFTGGGEVSLGNTAPPRHASLLSQLGLVWLRLKWLA